MSQGDGCSDSALQILSGRTLSSAATIVAQSFGGGRDSYYQVIWNHKKKKFKLTFVVQIPTT